LDAPLLLRYWHLSSLDAPTVAVVWSLGFAWAAGVRLPAWIPILLALVAWAVYIGDRLLDARAGLRTARLSGLRERHLFHWRHRRIFVPLGVAAACSAALIILVFMPAGARERNSVLAVAALLYFTRVHSSSSLSLFPHRSIFTKELLVGILFTAGCVLPAWSRMLAAGHPIVFSRLTGPVAFFALLAWLNCHSIECWESRLEYSRSVSPRQLRVFVKATFLALVGLILDASVATSQPRSAALLAAGVISALLLAVLDRVANRLSPVVLRAAADLCLLTPVLLAPLAWPPR
jgi:hypothetical protein